jgi:hypothetical protein
MTQQGLEKGRQYIQGVLEKMVQSNMKSGSRFYLIHFDSLSDEQKILLQQWRKVFPIYSRTEQQSPSKLLLDEVFGYLAKKGSILYEQKHYIGDTIEYADLNEALEVFMNFHLESYFNTSDLLPGVVQELSDYFRSFMDPGRRFGEVNGKIRIKPGCFVYEITKK